MFNKVAISVPVMDNLKIAVAKFTSLIVSGVYACHCTFSSDDSPNIAPVLPM